MSEGFPVFIGITGKRALSDDPAAAQALEAGVRRRLAAVFDYFDARFPGTPKILLTGAAAGSDLIVAEEVLGLRDDGSAATPRPDWLVVAALPFAEILFKEDFTPEQWVQYQRVLADPRTRLLLLPSLRTALGHPAEAADLQRRPDSTEAQRDLRNRHYEQVGLWIADTANVLLAIMAASEPADKIGGTARIVAVRRSTRPDPIAAEIFAASTILAPRPELLRAPSGHVWLIDPWAAPLCAVPPVTVLPPAQDDVPWPAVYKSPAAPRWDGAGGKADREAVALQATYLEESLRVIRVAGDFVRDRGIHTSATQPLAPLAWPEAAERVQILRRISASLSGPTNRASYEFRHTIYRLIGYFVLAVLAIETFAKFSPENPYVLAGYLFALGLAMLSYLRASSKNLQPKAEDRRAIHEALRVQAAWWQAGLDDRVDFVHLVGADQDLGRVRQAIRNVIVYALLASRWSKQPANWKALLDTGNWPAFVSDMAGRSFPRDWIGNQCYYFRQRNQQRRRRGEFLQAASWMLFATATCLAFLLLLRLLLPDFSAGLVHLATAVTGLPYWVAMIAAYVLTVAAGLCWWLGTRLMPEAASSWRRALGFLVNLPAALLLLAAAQLVATVVDHRNEPLWTFCAFLVPLLGYLVYFGWNIVPEANKTYPLASTIGLALVTLLALIVLAAAALFDHRYDRLAHDEHMALVGAYMTIVLVVFLPALGGALRFMSEKLAVEVEALTYRDAHLWFKNATEILSKIGPGRGDPIADEHAREIVRRLGILAMSESESWLKLRRQRPLSPVI